MLNPTETIQIFQRQTESKEFATGQVIGCIPVMQ